jgi:hypothetical protein
MGLRILQQYIRDAIAQWSDYDLTMGPLLTLSKPAHLYDDTFETANRVIATHYDRICKTRDFFDPAGNFVIELTNIDDAASGNNDALRLLPMLRNGDDALHARKNQDDCNNQDDRNQLEKKYLQNST